MRRSILAIAWVALAIGCGGGQPASESTPAPAAPAPPTGAERVSWYQDCWQIFNGSDWERLASCYGADTVSEEMDSGRDPARGGEAIIAATRPFKAAFPDVHGTPQIVVVNGTKLAALALMVGTHTGPLEGMGADPLPATNKQIGLYFGHVLEFDPASNTAVHEWSYNENGTMMAQLGLSKAPARPVLTSAPNPPAIAVATGSETETANVETFRAQVEAFNRKDLDAVVGYNAPDVVFHDLSQPKDSDGSSAREELQGFQTAFPDARISIDAIWGAADWVVAQGTFSGTNTGPAPMMGIKQPTGKPVNVHYLEFTRYRDGKIVDDWLLFDSMAFARQLGLM